MTRPAIRIENLGKRYVVEHERKSRTGYRTLRESIVDLATAPLRRLRGEGGMTHEEFWALKDVSFEVQPGEVVGIIGRNGAGKSTLLKILSQITKPTTGLVVLNGRVGSLLEVGTGFHPELTGRENIYLNGSILGMRKAEIDRRFDEIVDFAEIELFLDTPVKRYSSGMYVRLAFAVAAHLEPEMLIIDEVLAVGDAAFQRKCLGRMQAAAGAGRTVIFVSHNMAAVRSLCSRCVLVEKGRVAQDDLARTVTDYYVNMFETVLDEREGGPVPADHRWYNASSPEGVFLHPKDGHRKLNIRSGDPLIVEFDVETPKPIQRAAVGLTFLMGGGPIVSMSTKVQNVPSRPGFSRRWHVRCDLSTIPLNSGIYTVNVYFENEWGHVNRFSEAFVVRVEEHDVFGWGKSLPGTSDWGAFYWAPDWDVSQSA